MSKSPSFQFYPGDWLRNDVSGCSLEAQGLWMRMMMVMHDAQIYGQLVLNNRPMSAEFIAKKVGISPKKYANLLEELDYAGVINRKPNGVIYSGRMERDEAIRQQNRARQERHRSADNADNNSDVTDAVTEDVTGLSREKYSALHSSSSSSNDLKRLIDSACEKNSKIEPRIVELGVLQTLIRRVSKAPIKSVRYFDPEIKALAADSANLKPATLDQLIERRRQQYMEKQNGKICS